MIRASERERITIFDTTLRDGEQSPGATMTVEEKCQIAELLDQMRVDVIEAGYPAASIGDHAAVHAIAKQTKNAIVCGLARASCGDIDRCAEAIKTAKRGRINVVISTSPIHMKWKLQMNEDQVHELAAAQVGRARAQTDDVEWTCEDATRSEREFLCRCTEAVIKAGATTINLADTVGFALPEEYAELVRTVKERVPNADNATFSVHCHNDLGMAVSNSVAGICAGARQVECAINGIGERAGNTALEEIVMAIKVRSDALPYWTNVETQMFAQASELVSKVTSFPVQYNKAIVGRNAFAHEAGIHQDGILKNAQTYEIIKPESVGVERALLIMGKHSGRHAFARKVQELGYQPSSAALESAFREFKALADRKKHISDGDIEAIVAKQLAGR